MSRSGAPPGPPETGEPSGEDDDYKVGYGKPPRGSRFGSGNTMGKGRRKGSKNLGTIYNQIAGTKVATQINGKTRKVAKRELAMHQLVNAAAKGDFKSVVKMLELEQRYGPREDGAGLTADEQRRDADALRDFLQLRGDLQVKVNRDDTE